MSEDPQAPKPSDMPYTDWIGTTQFWDYWGPSLGEVKRLYTHLQSTTTAGQSLTAALLTIATVLISPEE